MIPLVLGMIVVRVVAVGISEFCRTPEQEARSGTGHQPTPAAETRTDQATRRPQKAPEPPRATTSQPQVRTATQKELLLQAHLRNQARQLESLRVQVQQDATIIHTLRAAVDTLEQYVCQLQAEKNLDRATIHRLQELVSELQKSRHALPPTPHDAAGHHA